MKKNISKIFHIYSCCVLVKGASRSIVQDLQRDKMVFIPNDLYDILLNYKKSTLGEIISHFGSDSENIILKYYEHLIKNDCGFFSDTYVGDNFPEIDDKFYYPNKISNSVIDINKNSQFNYDAIFEDLSALKCESLELRFFDIIPFKELELILLKCEKKSFRSINIVIPYTEELGVLNFLINLKKKCNRLSSMIIHSSPLNLIKENYYFYILYTKRIISNEFSCCSISTSSFNSKTEFYTESKQHNSCLYKKISVDVDGNIKNCPSMSKSFGNIKNTTFEKALEQNDFKELWNITKDQISICRDCEFRYVCTDCRAYVEDPKDILSKPLKCGYDPYINEWKEWSKNPLKQKTIAFYEQT